MRTPKRKSSESRAAEVIFDQGGVLILDRKGGAFWRLKRTGTEHGPFKTLIDALDDFERRAGADPVGEPEDWLDEIGYEAAYEPVLSAR
jgi:hypothetical protein